MDYKTFKAETERIYQEALDKRLMLRREYIAEHKAFSVGDTVRVTQEAAANACKNPAYVAQHLEDMFTIIDVRIASSAVRGGDIYYMLENGFGYPGVSREFFFEEELILVSKVDSGQ